MRCRELRREPAWVGAIRVAVTEGVVTPRAVIEEANLRSDRHRTVADVLATMADRDLLARVPTTDDSQRYVVGSVLMDAAPSPEAVEQLSDRALHRWGPRGTTPV